MTGISFHIAVIFFVLSGVLLLATGVILFVPSLRKNRNNKHEGDVPEQKKKLSKLCLAGFIIAALYPFLLAFDYFGLWRLGLALNKTWWEYDRTWLDLAEFFMPVTGIILSIAGLITARKKGRAGKKFGIAGIVLPNAYLAICVLIIIGNIVALFAETGKRGRIQEQREVYDMGHVGTHSNIEYDVSPYSIPEGYDFSSLNISVSEAELESYAGSKLQTISKTTDRSIRGVFQDYGFLIVRGDCFNAWLTDNNLNDLGYSNGYATLYYDYSWEFAAYGTNNLDVYKDPSDKFIIITNCGDHKIIAEFFEGIGEAVPTEETTGETVDLEFFKNNERVIFLENNINKDVPLSEIVDVFETTCNKSEDIIYFRAGVYYCTTYDHYAGEFASVGEGEYYSFELERWFKTEDGELYQIHVNVMYKPDTENERIRDKAKNTDLYGNVDENFFDYIRNSEAYKYASSKDIEIIDIYMAPL